MTHAAMRLASQDVGGCGLKNSVRHTLLRPPRVFTLQLGWKSQREQPHNIAATLAVVDETVRGCGAWFGSGCWVGSEAGLVATSIGCCLVIGVAVCAQCSHLSH